MLNCSPFASCIFLVKKWFGNLGGGGPSPHFCQLCQHFDRRQTQLAFAIAAIAANFASALGSRLTQTRIQKRELQQQQQQQQHLCRRRRRRRRQAKQSRGSTQKRF